MSPLILGSFIRVPGAGNFDNAQNPGSQRLREVVAFRNSFGSKPKLPEPLPAAAGYILRRRLETVASLRHSDSPKLRDGVQRKLPQAGGRGEMLRYRFTLRCLLHLEKNILERLADGVSG